MDWSENTGMQEACVNKPRYIMSITNDKNEQSRYCCIWPYYPPLEAVFYRFHTTNTFTLLFVYLPDNQFVKRRKSVNIGLLATISSRPSPSPQISLYSPPSCQARLSIVSCRSSSDLSFGGNLSPVGETRRVTLQLQLQICLVGLGDILPFLLFIVSWCACLDSAMRST